MTTPVVLGVDIGTSSTKGVLVDFAGTIVATVVLAHEVTRPNPGWVEMEGAVWWDEFCAIARQIVSDEFSITAVGVSGMGPCALVTDSASHPLRPAILYGIDSRAFAQISTLNAALDADAIFERCGSYLSSQAIGPKLLWIRETEPETYQAMGRLYMPNSWLAWNLTGRYVLDHHSASQCTPLYDAHSNDWYHPWVSAIAPGLELPELVWPSDVVGSVTAEAARQTGLPAGIPVVGGSIDAWMEAVSVDAANPGDLMLMYGTTMFLVATTDARTSYPTLWGTVGAFDGTFSLAGGMATSGAITGWLRELFGSPDFASLTREASASGAGARGIAMLPYFAGERTPIMDPRARGTIVGLTVEHTRGDLYRAALEAVAFGVRHNVETMRAAGVAITRIVAVGGGTQGSVWTQIVSDVTGLQQVIPRITIGASYGAALLAASSIEPVDITRWNPELEVCQPDPCLSALYDQRYALYRGLSEQVSEISHQLADFQLNPS
ncbi:FGGY-family carbohydrate kinase [Subtercola boreus]|uniref:FGGY-family carbohydrate kinase n=1 Tax=Subtercola boreus TaxID=120213 RepID=UPI000E2FE568|nr:FGGY family carbohydrate kinase [Subtercola boreus]